MPSNSVPQCHHVRDGNHSGLLPRNDFFFFSNPSPTMWPKPAGLSWFCAYLVSKRALNALILCAAILPYASGLEDMM